MYVKQAVVLVGGKGTRLGALTAQTPKPLLEISSGLRFLDVQLFELARHGFTDIVLLAGHLGDQVEALYAGKQILEATVRVLREPEPQGTGGALLFANHALDPWFVMTNGDSLFEINYRNLTRGIDESFEARLALREVGDPGRYGSVFVDGDVVTGFREKDPSLPGPGLINGGIYAVSRKILERIPGPCSLEQDVFPQIASAGRMRGQRFDAYFLDIGLPNTYEQARHEIPARFHRRCAFLDRDGVLNRDKGYTHKTEDLHWMPGARDAVRMLNDAGYLTIVVSNQAGVARGYYTEDDVHAFHRHMNRELGSDGAHIDAFYYCPYHKDGTVARYVALDHPDRKPNPGLILRALKDLPIRKEGSFLIGDKQDDLEAAKSAGLPGHLYAGSDLSALVQRLIGQPH